MTYDYVGVTSRGVLGALVFRSTLIPLPLMTPRLPESLPSQSLGY